MNYIRIVIGVLAVSVLAAGIYLWINPESALYEKVANYGILKSNKNLPLIIRENFEYHPGAMGYLVKPDGEGNYPGVIMIHENRGLRPEIKAAAENLAKEGYVVMAVDLLGGAVETQEEARELTAKFNQAEGVKNMRNAVAYLRSRGVEKIASLGWCFGGRQSVELAISGEELDATVVYYGGGMATTTERLFPIDWPVLGIFGDKDTVIPVETVRAFEKSLNRLGIKNEIYIYEDVGHAFANPSGANYAPEKTKDAWSKTLDFLEKYLK